MSKKNKQIKSVNKKSKSKKETNKEVKDKNTTKKNNEIQKEEINTIKIDNSKKKINKPEKKQKKSSNKNKEKQAIDLNYNTLSIEQIEKELKKETYKSKYFNILSSTVYGLIIIAALAALIATLIMPVFQISGSSMAPEFNNGDLVISIKTKNLNSGDVIAFYHGNKILVKRVIASAGEWVVIDEEGNVYVDGVLLQESYVDEKVLGDCDIKFPYQVPSESWFVLADDRTNSTDSRNNEIGSIKEEDIIGKVLFKLWDANK